MPENRLDRMLRIKIFGKSPVGAFLRVNRFLWNGLPPRATKLGAVRAYGRFLHAVVRRYADRTQYFGTFFLRNRPQLEQITRLSDHVAKDSRLNIAVLGCSNGAEVYSILATLRESRPGLKVTLHAVDISADVLALAQTGTYSIASPEVVGEAIFQRLTEGEFKKLFDRTADRATIRPWIKEGIVWQLGDVRDPDVLNRLGLQDIVVANNFLCHMRPPQAEECLLGIARLIRPGGYLIVSGIDLAVRKRVAADHHWKPVDDLLEDVHDGDVALRRDWPFNYWGLEPLDKAREDWSLRYAAAFRIGQEESQSDQSLEYHESVAR